MVRSIISLLVVLVLVTVFSGCSSARKSNSELRGLMLLETTQLGRNRSYYSRHDANRLEKKHKKFHKKIKKKGSGKRQ